MQRAVLLLGKGLATFAACKAYSLGAAELAFLMELPDCKFRYYFEHFANASGIAWCSMPIFGKPVQVAERQCHLCPLRNFNGASGLRVQILLQAFCQCARCLVLPANIWEASSAFKLQNVNAIFVVSAMLAERTRIQFLPPSHLHARHGLSPSMACWLYSRSHIKVHNYFHFEHGRIAGIDSRSARKIWDPRSSDWCSSRLGTSTSQPKR